VISVPRLVVPHNISIIALPPKFPELNPVENVWQFMRDNWLSNRIFKSYDDLVDHCCEAWNKLVDQPHPRNILREHIDLASIEEEMASTLTSALHFRIRNRLDRVRKINITSSYRFKLQIPTAYREGAHGAIVNAA
jgi:hypothetical protein